MDIRAHLIQKIVSGPTTEDPPLTLLNNVTFTLPSGSQTAIVGPSGSGKSTLLSLLAGLDKVTSGTLTVGPYSLHDLDEDHRAKVRREHMAFIFQNFQLLPHLNARENIEFALEVRGLDPYAMRMNVDNVLQAVHLAHRQKAYPKTLSGGEQQRVAIARALVVKPAVLFADEPTGSLDTQTGCAVEDLLFDLSTKMGCTLVLVTHDIRLANRCETQLYIHSGMLLSTSEKAFV